MTNQTPPVNQSDNGFDLRELLMRAWQGLIKNWGMKLIALLISIFLWAGLIAQDPTLTREKTF